ncbi:MAG: InlB B-repeat-containing protein, partial [Clostridia bacterium]
VNNGTYDISYSLYPDEATVTNIADGNDTAYLVANWEDGSITFKNLEKTGYEFLGWKSDTGEIYFADETVTISENVTFTAQWKANTYTVSFDDNTTDTVGNMPSSQTKTHGVSLTLRSNTPTRTGYTFQGWSTSSGTSNTVNYLQSASYTANASDILYAVWEANTYTVSYNDNTTDTVGNMPSSQTKTYNVPLILRDNTPTRDGYIFQGWSTSSGIDNTVNYAQGATYTENENLLLYAVWKTATDIYPVFIEPNSSYRNDVEIVVSFYIYNDGVINFTPSNAVDVSFVATATSSSGITSIISDENCDIIIPADEKNLVYFKVLIPSNCQIITFDVSVSTSETESDMTNNLISVEKNVYSTISSQTEDITFENTPNGFSIPTASLISVSDSCFWNVWEWENGTFKDVSYGIQLSADVNVTADTAVQTEIVNGDITTLKSGYGIQLSAETNVSTASTYETPSTDAYTTAQNGNVYFPEYAYSMVTNNYRTLELVSDTLMFEQNIYTNTSDGLSDLRRVHFVPLWYPNTTYTLKTFLYDIWTPAGMLSVSDINSQIEIDGTIYEDWVH